MFHYSTTDISLVTDCLTFSKFIGMKVRVYTPLSVGNQSLYQLVLLSSLCRRPFSFTWAPA